MKMMIRMLVSSLATTYYSTCCCYCCCEINIDTGLADPVNIGPPVDIPQIPDWHGASPFQPLFSPLRSSLNLRVCYFLAFSLFSPLSLQFRLSVSRVGCSLLPGFVQTGSLGIPTDPIWLISLPPTWVAPVAVAQGSGPLVEQSTVANAYFMSCRVA